ncbi:MAG: hypothetical protein KIS66_05255 [Fimbriimonadaceae bacterium]|nr:hypothetical protein [Fimbriimonadaceae bacterium]
MRGIRIGSAVAALVLAAGALAQDNAGVPFAISVEEETSGRFASLPGLHSFAFGRTAGHWVFVTGRTNGFHGFVPPGSSFSRGLANRTIWVVMPLGKPGANVWSMPLADVSLPTMVRDQLSSANTCYTQDGDDLVVVGGYGHNSYGERQTYPLLTVLDLPKLVQAVKSGNTALAADAVRSVEDARMRVTGGELRKLDDGRLYLVFGHDFHGIYLAPDQQQVYTEEVRRFEIQKVLGYPQVVSGSYQPWTHPTEFHRRDLNVEHTILPDGTLGLGAYGGVFTPPTLPNGDPNPNADDVYLAPVYVAPTGYSIAGEYAQRMSQYTCANMRLYDRQTRTMYTTFFGGLSRYTYDRAARSFVIAPKQGAPGDPDFLDGVPWIDTVTTLVRNADGAHREHAHHEAPLPMRMGANAKFVPVAKTYAAYPTIDHGILDLWAIRRRTHVGWIVGGIVSPVAQNANDTTWAMSKVYRVYLDPTPTGAR